MDEGISLNEVIKVVVRKFKIFILIVLIAIIIPVVKTKLQDNRYEAKGLILVMSDTQILNDEKSGLARTINSFIRRDFILKKALEDLDIDIDVFYKNYELVNELDNSFINLSCTSKYKENNILIINKIIDELILFQNNNEMFEVNIKVLEYASYNISLSKNYLKPIIIGLGLGFIVCFAYLIWLMNYSKYVLCIDEIKRKSSNVFEYKDIPTSMLVKLLEENKHIYIDNINDEIKERLKCINNDILFSNNYCSLNNKNIVFSDNESLIGSTSLYIKIIDIRHTLRAEIKRFNLEEANNKYLVIYK